MDIIDLNRDVYVANSEHTRTIVSNGLCLGNAIMRELIGRELGNSPEIDLGQHLNVVISNEISSAVKG